MHNYEDDVWRLFPQIVTDRGMTWANMASPVSDDDDLTFLQLLFTMTATCGVCAVVTWYVEHVNPGDFGVAQPLWFPLSVSSYMHVL